MQAAAIEGPENDLMAVGRAGGRIRRFAEAIEQAHSFNIGPGAHGEPWTIDFQRLAMPVYCLTLPWDYLAVLGHRFEACADLMVGLTPPDEATLQWSRVQMYLRSYSRAAREGAPADTAPQAPESPNLIMPTTPPVMPFNLLAELLSTDGAVLLRDAGTVVEASCGQLDESPLTEQERNWIHAIARGDRMLDIAISTGYSERTLYRALNLLWHRLGVSSRVEAVALANKNGWLS